MRDKGDPAGWVRRAGSGACWGRREIFIGQTAGPDRVPCAKSARAGHLTCHWHKKYEDAAQALKARPVEGR